MTASDDKYLEPRDLFRYVLNRPTDEEHRRFNSSTGGPKPPGSDVSDSEAIYAFLLGFRLYLSPHHLLTEIDRIAKEDRAGAAALLPPPPATSLEQLPGTATCPVCHRLRQSDISSIQLEDYIRVFQSGMNGFADWRWQTLDTVLKQLASKKDAIVSAVSQVHTAKPGDMDGQWVVRL